MARVLRSDEEVLALMKRRQGHRTNAEYARELGVTKQFLGDVYLRRRFPGPTILAKLGLRREVRYVPVADEEEPEDQVA